MAHYKRKRPRTAARHTTSRGYWLSHWPRWWDIVFHTRPHRRRTNAMLTRVRITDVDVDDLAWPLQHKPHIYFW